MEYMKIRKKDSNIVPCVKSIPEKPKGIVIAIHGFSSSKECSTFSTDACRKSCVFLVTPWNNRSVFQ